jgi:hypothetical protein
MPENVLDEELKPEPRQTTDDWVCDKCNMKNSSCTHEHYLEVVLCRGCLRTIKLKIASLVDLWLKDEPK